jgi:predicted AAA+ superfamily ATPase
MLARWITGRLVESLGQVPAVALLGPRQVGKTTLARMVGQTQPSLYLDLEAPEDLLKLNDPGGYLSQHGDRLVIIDEIQRSPDLFMVLRGLIDRNRERGRPAGHFLLLGSASMDLLRQSSESLAGRIRYLDMSGLNLLEAGVENRDRLNLWFRGGFPTSYVSGDDVLAMDWLEDLIRTYLERDVPQMGFRVPASRLRRLWTMLAHNQGEPVNCSKLGGNLEIDGKTVSHYLDILVDLLLVRRLPPWYANSTKRLVKSPRFYIRDSGIVHRLLGIDNYEALLSHPVLGKSWEGFVIENLHSVLPRRAETYYYRTAAGAEIDLVIRLSSSDVWAIEIKHGTAPKVGKPIIQTFDDIGATRKFVVYGGDDEFPAGDGVTVISLRGLMNKLELFGSTSPRA